MPRRSWLAPGLTYGEALGGIGLYEDNNAGLKKFTQEIRLASPSSDKLEWQVGGYYTHEDGALLQHCGRRGASDHSARLTRS